MWGLCLLIWTAPSARSVQCEGSGVAVNGQVGSWGVVLCRGEQGLMCQVPGVTAAPPVH